MIKDNYVIYSSDIVLRGAFELYMLTLVCIPKRSKIILFSWDNKRKLIRIDSDVYDLLVCIGEGVPFSIYTSEFKRNRKIRLFFNKPFSSDKLKVNKNLDSKNVYSRYFINLKKI